MIPAYIILSGHEDIDMECFFNVYTDSYTRGYPFKLKKNRGNTVRHILIFSYRTVNGLNGLPSSIVL